MKAISVKQPWASMIARGKKTIETRLWHTKYRGDLVIASSKKPDLAAMEFFGYQFDELPLGQALCIVNVVDCRTMTFKDEVGARCKWYPRANSLILEDLRAIEPFQVKGQLGIYEIDVEGKIHVV